MAILKILARHSPSYGSLVRYILNDAKAEKVEVYVQNIRSTDIDTIVKEFIENEAFRRQNRSDQIYLFHEILSFAAQPEVEITKEMIDDLVAKYMELRGDTGVMLGAVHRDRANTVHAHFAVSALEYRTGRSFGMSNAQLRELKTAFQGYHREKYPELTRSLPQHGKGGRHERHFERHAQARELIAGQVRQCFASATSQRDFLDRLLQAGLPHYERGGKVSGIEHGGQRFRFSSLLDEGRQLADLPEGRIEEETALEAIRAVRERQRERDDRGRDVEDRER